MASLLSAEARKARNDKILKLWAQGLTAQEIMDRGVGLKSRGALIKIVSAARDRGDKRAVLHKRGCRVEARP